MIKFTKMQGVGNDFIVIEKRNLKSVENINEFARKICNRNFGVGADGLLVVNTCDYANYTLSIYNSDGSEASMCGNGVRCIAKYYVDKYGSDKDKLSVHTKSGIKEVSFSYNNNDFYATVDIGSATFDKGSMELYTDQSVIYNYPLKTLKGTFNITCVYLGNLHTVIFVNNLMLYPFDEIALCIQKNPLFLNSTNIEFVVVNSRSSIEMLVYERGCGETLGCGTGASAAAYVSFKMNKVDDFVNVHLKGGDLSIKLDTKTKHIFLTGDAKTVFTGEIDI